ncbi:hypothetical protein HPB50_000341 [Hyalomma asiaticum]|uniref:Uncharacterized protein n=1 Tax=Hyalomma asiaticum TaxID=266040 RepID=A0ACB7S3K1_HYAAI|nr:hypothetical protein HPB50_000341 [Hyalomma asiaticum]
MEMHRKYGPIFVEELSGRYPLVHITRGTDIRELHREEGKAPFRVGAAPFKYYRSSRPRYYAEAGLLNLQGKVWHKIRSSTQPHTLKARTTASYFPTMDRISDEALALIDKAMDENGNVEDCFFMFQRWALESVASITANVNLGCLKHPLDTSDGAAILEDIITVFECMQKFAYRFPCFHYIRTPTWRRFEKAMDDFTERTYRHIEAAARRVRRQMLESEPTILRSLILEKKMTSAEIFTFTSDFILSGVDTVRIFIDYYVAGHISENFDNPEIFFPERWLKMEQGDLHSDRYASLPFSFGPRMCPGRKIAELQLCLLVAKILLKYEVYCEKEDFGIRARLGNVPNESVDLRFKAISSPSLLKMDPTHVALRGHRVVYKLRMSGVLPGQSERCRKATW